MLYSEWKQTVLQQLATMLGLPAHLCEPPDIPKPQIYVTMVDGLIIKIIVDEPLLEFDPLLPGYRAAGYLQTHLLLGGNHLELLSVNPYRSTL